jgi:hypothetical protein
LSQPDRKSKRIERSGLILEPSKAKGQVNLTVMRGDNGVMFSMVDVINGCSIPLGDCVITWQKLDLLLECLNEYRNRNAPKHYFLDLDPGHFGSNGGNLQ